jgi:NADPH:quinone reductase-like Zn-dependent oxidoreductase
MVITQANRVVRNQRPYHLRTPPHCRPVVAAAWLALVEIGRVRPGQRVFVNGALGGVGQVAVDIAKAMGASLGGGVGPDALEDAAAIGIDTALDYTQDVPASLDRRFDIVVDANGSLSPAQGDALTKRGGVAVDTNPSAGKFMRSLLSRRRKVVMGLPPRSSCKRSPTSRARENSRFRPAVSLAGKKVFS